VKRFTFSTADLLTGSSTNMLVSRIFHDKSAGESVEDFYLNNDITGSKGKIVVYAIAIAAAFAVPQLFALSKASPATDISTYIVVIVAALALGFLATIKDALKFK
jgi:hypothetical protein